MLWLYDYSSRNERPIIWSRLVSRGSHSDAETRVSNISRYLLGLRIQCEVKAHFQHDLNSVVQYNVLFMKGWCLYSSSVKQYLLSVNRDQFLKELKENDKHKTMFHLTSGWESSLGKMYHRNSTAARTGTWNPAWATKKASSCKYIERPLKLRVNKHRNKAKWL